MHTSTLEHTCWLHHFTPLRFPNISYHNACGQQDIILHYIVFKKEWLIFKPKIPRKGMLYHVYI